MATFRLKKLLVTVLDERVMVRDPWWCHVPSTCVLPSAFDAVEDCDSPSAWNPCLPVSNCANPSAVEPCNDGVSTCANPSAVEPCTDGVSTCANPSAVGPCTDGVSTICDEQQPSVIECTDGVSSMCDEQQPSVVECTDGVSSMCDEQQPSVVDCGGTSVVDQPETPFVRAACLAASGIAVDIDAFAGTREVRAALRTARDEVRAFERNRSSLRDLGLPQEPRELAELERQLEAALEAVRTAGERA